MTTERRHRSMALDDGITRAELMRSALLVSLSDGRIDSAHRIGLRALQDAWARFRETLERYVDERD